MKVLYPNFLKDPIDYAQVEALWREGWTKLFPSKRKMDQWKTPWINNSFADGTPCRDGNPVFSAVCPARRLGVRVIQQEPNGDSGEFAFWTDTFAQGDADAIKELVVSCVLTAETLKDGLDLIGRWLNEEEIEISPAHRARRRTG